DRIKALYWDENGMVLLYKRLEDGNRFQWPRTTEDAMEITPQQYRWLMEGLKIEQPKANRPVNTEGLCFS
ncbi:MAG TPA: IS66 family insertion sequence element accessory protein TnpB, partial [Methanocorpusculum sp.]|nr:IS66 family insertion sequence element accessory protein TnpB [Methanocorpusculum sp.]